MDRRVIPSPMDTVFEFDYSVQAEDMRSLYEKAKRDQWNAARDIAWETPETSDGRILADELIDIHDSPIWSRLAEKDRVDLNRRIAAWRLSVLVRRAGRVARMQPARRHGHRDRSEIFPGDPGDGRGPPQRGAGAVPLRAAGRAPLSDARERAHHLRLHPDRS